MNKAEIETVERLRREGKGLSAIAQETGISINTIKSHCSRHGIPAPRLIRTCLFCNIEIKTKDHFCSDACRAEWYESHSSDEQDILRLCKTCGKPFEPHQPKQVYCSKQCFYNDRYHSKQSTISAFWHTVSGAPLTIHQAGKSRNKAKRQLIRAAFLIPTIILRRI